jgi:hypothetical protein
VEKDGVAAAAVKVRRILRGHQGATWAFRFERRRIS